MTAFLRKGEWCVVLFGVSLMILMLLPGATASGIGGLIFAILVVILMTMTALIILLGNDITAILHKGRWYIGLVAVMFMILILLSATGHLTALFGVIVISTIAIVLTALRVLLGNKVKIVNRYRERFHQSLGSLATVFLMLPILTFVWPAAKDPFLSVIYGKLPYDVISGKLFTTKFHIIHAGSALDQPTIGKWLFWFTVMTALSLPYAAAVRWLSDRRDKVGYLAYSIPAVILSIFLLCILSWPMCWLIQYVCSMGFTPRRVYGLIYGIAGCILVFGFLCRAIKKPKGKKNTPNKSLQ